MQLGDERDERKGAGERSCPAAAPGGISSQMCGTRRSGTGFAWALSGTATHLAVPAAGGAAGTCRRFVPAGADLLFVRREPFIWGALASAASFHARRSGAVSFQSFTRCS